MAICFASAVCVIGLSCLVYLLSRRVAQLRVRIDDQAAILSKLAVTQEVQAQSIGDIHSGFAEKLRDFPASYPMEGSAARISKDELQALLDDVCASGHSAPTHNVS